MRSLASVSLRLLAVSFAVAVALLAAPAAGANVSLIVDSQYELGVRNDDGDWYIAKECLGTQW